MKFSEIPNNRLTDQIKVIIKLCHTLVEDYGESAFEFNPPISNDEIDAWEKKNGLVIPDCYKEWLCFSKHTRIKGNTAIFYEPNEFVIDNDKKSLDVPDDCIVIGELGGWGISLCFSSTTGEIMYFDHDEQYVVSDFSDILDWVIDRLEECV